MLSIIHVGTIGNQKMCATSLQACLLLGFHAYLDNVHIYITTKNILAIALSSELQPTDTVSCLQYSRTSEQRTLWDRGLCPFFRGCPLFRGCPIFALYPPL